MVNSMTPIPSFDCVVFGGTGDLAQRKLIPALYQRYRSGYFQQSMRIIGLSRSIKDDETFKNLAAKALKTYVPQEDLDEAVIHGFLDCFYGLKMDIDKALDWENLACRLNDSPNRVRAFYLAVSPDLFGLIAKNIGDYHLIQDETRIILEKPIGRDYHSAFLLNNMVGEVFSEEQIFRIDHYLGKETVQNLMALRFANMLYEPLWNARYIKHIEILTAEEVGLEKRASYYDQAGALRDMVQNHMLQLLCLTAMEPPFSKDANAVRDEKVKILKALKPIDFETSENCTVRGQYSNGVIKGKKVASYQTELGDKMSNTETYVALRVEIMNWRWANMPFYLRTGKRLKERVSEIVVTFRPIPHNIFDIDGQNILPNRLVIRLQPGEGVTQWVMMKSPEPGPLKLRALPLDMLFFDKFKGRHPEAYERLLTDAIRGDQTLFMRRDEVELAWHWIDPILKAWQVKEQKPYAYPSGSWGPKEADRLIEQDGGAWFKPML